MTTVLFVKSFENTDANNIKRHSQTIEECKVDYIPYSPFSLFFSVKGLNYVVHNENLFTKIYDWDYGDKIVEYWGFLANDVYDEDFEDYRNTFLNNYMDSFIFDLDDTFKIVGTSIILAKDKSTLDYISFSYKDFKDFLYYVEEDYFKYERNIVLNNLSLDINDIKKLLANTETDKTETRKLTDKSRDKDDTRKRKRILDNSPRSDGSDYNEFV